LPASPGGDRRSMRTERVIPRHRVVLRRSMAAERHGRPDRKGDDAWKMGVALTQDGMLAAINRIQSGGMQHLERIGEEDRSR